MIILGIDPGTRITGYGLIRVQGNKFEHLDNGCIVAQTTKPMKDRLTFISDKIDKIIEQHQPEVIALEKAFFAKNASSALKLGQCRGVIMVAAGRASLPLSEYSPSEIKQAVTGSGRAHKEQIQKMIRLRLGLPEDPQSDASDALAVAICHGQSYGMAKRINA
jgi:crossover junction endodeoxyribonuclease RuvC